jgi:hypothetical protein
MEGVLRVLGYITKESKTKGMTGRFFPGVLNDIQLAGLPELVTRSQLHPRASHRLGRPQGKLRASP